MGNCYLHKIFNSLTKIYRSFLIYSTTRVTPNKGKLSIPRKELNGIVLVCEKLLYISQSLGISITIIYAHTDSLASIHLIGINKNCLNTYVSNRVAKIHKTSIHILFVPGKENPANLVSKPKPCKDYIKTYFGQLDNISSTRRQQLD